MPMIQPVILSGGSGTRLWPASRAAYPKQLLKLFGGRTMLQDTALRVRDEETIVDSVIVVCSETHRFLVTEQLHAIDVRSTIVLEQVARNTAPAAALAALLLLSRYETADEAPLMLVMPADHVMTDAAQFLEAVSSGQSSARRGRLVCFGVTPTYAATGYGYIESVAGGLEAASIASFVEKPDKQTATGLVETGRHFWNAGIFLMRADTYLAELQEHAPDILAACKSSFDAAECDGEYVRPDPEAFALSPSDSIDYAVMENTTLGDVVPITAGWSDVGCWSAIHDASHHDEVGNTLTGDVVAVDCENSFISSKSRLVAAVGIADLIVVEEKDAVLVTSRNRSQDVKQLVDAMHSSDRHELELHREVFRPWGSYDSIDSGDGFQVKRLIVEPGAVLSLQKHAHRAEHWVVVRGQARITRDDEVFDLCVNESTYIPIGAVHRIENPGTEPAHIIEVQCGDYLGEDDIVRLEDNYGRAGTST